MIQLPRELLPRSQYQELLRYYRENDLDIPLSKYIEIGAGTCREHSLLLQVLLNEIDSAPLSRIGYLSQRQHFLLFFLKYYRPQDYLLGQGIQENAFRR